MPSNKKARQKIIEILKKKEGRDVADLGSGWGNICTRMAKTVPDAQITGYEISWIPWLTSSFFFRQKNIRYLKRNFLKTDLNKHDILVCYLYPGGMKKLQKKLEKDKYVGWIISNTFQVPDWKPVAKYKLDDLYGSSLYVYRKY